METLLSFISLLNFATCFHGISQWVIGNGEQLRVLPDPLFYISGRCLFPIAESVLDKVGRIFGFSVIIKFHTKIITQARYIYNTIQQ